jgi:hypothetical protein
MLVHVHENWVQIEHRCCGLQDTRKGKEPMEEDEMSNHAFTTHSKNIIKVGLCSFD